MGEKNRLGSSVIAVLEASALTGVAVVVALLVGIVFVVQLVVLGYRTGTSTVIVGATALGQVGFLLVGYGYIRYRDITVPVRKPSMSDLLYVAGGTVAALVAAAALSYVLFVLDLVPDSVIGEIAMVDPTFLLMLAVLSVLIVAPAEELLFRGAVQGRLRERFGSVGAVAGSSLLFGSVHLSNYAGDIMSVTAGALLIAFVGVVFGALYERTENLAVPIFVHAIYNVVLLVTSYLSVVYG